MAEGLKKKVEESYTHVFGEKLNLKEEVSRLKEEYGALEESMAQGIDKMASKKIADAKLVKDFQAVLKEFQKLIANSGKTPEQRAVLVESKMQEVLFSDNEFAFNEAIIEEREHGIQEIQ
ncbi:syntaxin-23-like [Arachis duranensis]|uniref:Syntaxin-23-like n=1 Tax=Arachis duranensis TaxID=130453 RepID=A0A9C6TPI4_ARADU|nr:syntaxin-23-like [Arachis duranensis]